MIDDALAYVGLQFAKFQFRSDFDQVQPMTEFIRSSRNVLIMLPNAYEDAILAGNALRELRKRNTQLQLTVVNNSTWATPLADFQKCEIVRLDPTDINRFSLPTRKFLQRVFQRQYDVAVDLNLDFVLHTAYICKASHAKVRVGFAHPVADLFFNVQINVGRKHSPQALYETFAKCLGMF